MDTYGAVASAWRLSAGKPASGSIGSLRISTVNSARTIKGSADGSGWKSKHSL
ncbi:hypothetical protein P4I20_23400 [Paenibacillus graminis]